MNLFRALYPRPGGNTEAAELLQLRREMSKISDGLAALKTTVTNVVAEVATLKADAATDQDAADITTINTQLAALLPTAAPAPTEPATEPPTP